MVTDDPPTSADFATMLNAVSGVRRWKPTVMHRCAELIRASEVQAPPTPTGLVAEMLGLEPGPRARMQFTDGIINLDTGLVYVRICAPGYSDRPLNLESERIISQVRVGQSRPLSASERARIRFSYAHELGHALFYDFTTCPARRIAPQFGYRNEEVLCNVAAAHLLLPPAWIEPEFLAHERPSPKLLCDCARNFLVSLYVVAIRAAASFAPRLPPDAFYMLSRRMPNVNGWGEKKPRCMVAFSSDHMRNQRFSFLSSYQGINHVQTVDRVRRQWSLEEMHDGPGFWQCQESGPHTEKLQCPDGSIVRLESTHTRLQDGATIWTEGRIEIISRPLKRRRGVRSSEPCDSNRV